MKRRDYVSSLVCGLTAMGGCLSRRSGGPRTSTPARLDPGTSESAACRDDRQRYDRTWNVLDAHEEFELTADPTTVSRGEPITFRLHNRTSEEQMTGNDSKYALQRKSADGWKGLFYYPDEHFFTDEGIVHQPGEGFTWEFTASKAGFSQDSFRVCTEIAAGRYRFLYWGIVDDREGGEGKEEGESALAAEFTVTD